MPRSAVVESDLAERVTWQARCVPGHRPTQACYLGTLYLGRIMHLEVGWLVVAVRESGVLMANEQARGPACSSWQKPARPGI